MSGGINAEILNTIVRTAVVTVSQRAALLASLFALNASLGWVIYLQNLEMDRLRSRLDTVASEQNRRSETHKKMLEFLTIQTQQK